MARGRDRVASQGSAAGMHRQQVALAAG
jgi:hypothetical protein